MYIMKENECDTHFKPYKGAKGGNTVLEIMTNEAESSAKIIVVGVGGAGNNAVNRMVACHPLDGTGRSGCR